MNIKKVALIGGLASTLSGCCGYYTTGTYVAPVSGTYVAPTTYVAPATYVAPSIVVPAFSPLWWEPRFHHHHGRWR